MGGLKCIAWAAFFSLYKGVFFRSAWLEMAYIRMDCPMAWGYDVEGGKVAFFLVHKSPFCFCCTAL